MGKLIIILSIFYTTNLFGSEIFARKNDQKELSSTYIPYLERNSPHSSEDQLNPQYQQLLVQTGYMMILGLGAISALWSMPSQITKWNKEEILQDGNAFARYKQNIGTGPVWDQDELWINYIGHPLSGAAYYTMCRQNALSKSECFMYSVGMSTFYWEYGFEALAEVPSKQDLLITPTVGSILGEIFHHWKQKIKKNSGMLLDSSTLGSIGMFLLDPAGHTTNGMHRFSLSTSNYFSSAIKVDRKLENMQLELSWVLD